MTRKKFIEIVLTALVGAMIAILQGVLVSITNSNAPVADPAVAATAAGVLKLILGKTLVT